MRHKTHITLLLLLILAASMALYATYPRPKQDLIPRQETLTRVQCQDQVFWIPYKFKTKFEIDSYCESIQKGTH